MNETEILGLLGEVGWSAEAVSLGRNSNFCCEYCDRNLLAALTDYDTWTTDHIIAQSKGGPHMSWNLALCCRLCNCLKASAIVPFDPRSERAAAIAHIRAIVKAARAAKEARFRRSHELLTAAGWLIRPLVSTA